MQQSELEILQAVPSPFPLEQLSQHEAKAKHERISSSPLDIDLLSKRQTKGSGSRECFTDLDTSWNKKQISSGSVFLNVGKTKLQDIKLPKVLLKTCHVTCV